jgi:cytoskeleton protein RodZ
MVDEDESESALFPERVGDKLRTARIAAGMDLTDVATKTRVPLRHLTAIEAGDYESLPSPTYCVGFVKAFARCVGENESGLALQLREELGQRPTVDRYEPALIDEDDSGSVFTRKLALTAAGIGVALLIGFLALRSSWTNQSPTPDSVEQVGTPVPETADLDPAPATPVNAKGEVVLTAKEGVWLRIYDANDKVLFEKEMTPNERFVIPADANKPMIRTGRADLLAVTVDGKEVAALGPAERTIKDVEVSATALAARSPAPGATTAQTPLSPPQP